MLVGVSPAVRPVDEYDVGRLVEHSSRLPNAVFSAWKTLPGMAWHNRDRAKPGLVHQSAATTTSAGRSRRSLSR